jgi:cardiolipin synthase
VFVWLFVNGRENAAVIVYGAGAFTDFLDGYVARKTESVTELGKVLDPLADRIFIVALCAALVARDVLPPWLAAAVVARDALVVGLWPALARRTDKRIGVNRTGKTATAFLLVGLTWLALSQTTFSLGRIGRPVGLACTLAGAALYWIAAALYGRAALDGRKRLGDLSS